MYRSSSATDLRHLCAYKTCCIFLYTDSVVNGSHSQAQSDAHFRTFLSYAVKSADGGATRSACFHSARPSLWGRRGWRLSRRSMGTARHLFVLLSFLQSPHHFLFSALTARATGTNYRPPIENAQPRSQTKSRMAKLVFRALTGRHLVCLSGTKNTRRANSREMCLITAASSHLSSMKSR